MKPKKIALVGFHLSGGGAARVMANLSNYFHDQGLEVHIIILHDQLGYSYSGVLFNLGKLKSKTNSVFNKIKRLLQFRAYVKKHNFDIIIDFRFRKRVLQEWLINRLVYGEIPVVYTVHSSKLDIYLPKSNFWANAIYGNCHSLVTITQEMEAMVKGKYPGLNNVNTISNPLDVSTVKDQAIEDIDLDFNYIIGAGTYDTSVKQFDKLIEAYAKSQLPLKNIHLVILGTGKLLNFLKLVARDLGVSNHVHFIGFQPNPYKYFSKARFFVLSSKYEGMPMVLIEALCCEIPVVSFDCPTGPKEIITNRVNGVLVPNQQLHELTNAMNRLINDEQLYATLKQGTLASIEKFSLNTIGKQWMKLIKVDK